MESNPHIVQIVPPNEVVVVIGFELKLGSRAGTMSLCIPFTVVESLMQDISAENWFQTGRQRTGDQWARLIADQLADARLEMTALLAETTITVADLRTLEVGDLIMTEKSAAAPATIRVGEVPKFLAHVGRYKGNRAVKIVRPIGPNDRF
jgi:flagellar motor switch protein FliM